MAFRSVSFGLAQASIRCVQIEAKGPGAVVVRATSNMPVLLAKGAVRRGAGP